MRNTLIKLSLALPLAISLIGLLGGMYVAGKMVLAEAKAMENQNTILIRDLTLIEKQKLFLLENVKDIRSFKELNAAFQCESGWKQEAINYQSGDYGIAQINEYYWDKIASSLGLDYKNSWQDNILMAIYIYHHQGISAWQWSYACQRRVLGL